MSLRVGACQTPEILGDVDAALACIEEFATHDVDLLLFSECFLQGYLVEEKHLSQHALELDSPGFDQVLERLRHLEQTLVFGVIEKHRDDLFNTAVVVRRGALVGAYRKTHLVPGEALFRKGDTYPTFECGKVRFGINICYDTRFPEAAASIAAQGARLLLVAAQNMTPREKAEHWKDLHDSIRAQRARETGMWLVSADVTGERDEHRIGYGPTSVINPHGEVVAQVPLGTTGLVVAEIDDHQTNR